MTEENKSLNIVCSPHMSNTSFTSRRMMLDVIIALLPVIAVALWVFREYAEKQLLICIGTALASEALFTAMRKRPFSLLDGSALVTALILALSLPGTAPWYVGVIASVIAISLGKVVFGGLGQNLFNPAMVGRAFVMIAFAGAMGANAYMMPAGENVIDAMTSATPLTVLKTAGVAELPSLMNLLIGNVNGSLGETSALACLLGGIYLCIRRTAAFEIPLAAIITVALLALGGGVDQVLPHLLGGAFLFGAFFIATDPVSSPVTPKGRWIFGALFGAIVMLLRKLSGYPEGVMFAVLLANGLAPLINRWTIPTPLGGPIPERK
ncbi:RnfABCDGE type electron transport complex subunit D [Verrucomicrobiota bacterium]